MADSALPLRKRRVRAPAPSVTLHCVLEDELECSVCFSDLVYTLVEPADGTPHTILTLPASFRPDDLLLQNADRAPPVELDGVGLRSACQRHQICMDCWCKAPIIGMTVTAESNGHMSIACFAPDRERERCVARIPVVNLLRLKPLDQQMAVLPLITALTTSRAEQVRSICQASSQAALDTEVFRFYSMLGMAPQPLTPASAALCTISVPQYIYMQRYLGYTHAVCNGCNSNVCVECHAKIIGTGTGCTRCMESPTGHTHSPIALSRHRAFNRFLPHPNFAPAATGTPQALEEIGGVIGSAQDTMCPMIRSASITAAMAVAHLLKLAQSKTVVDHCPVCRLGLQRSVDCNVLTHCNTDICTWCGYFAPIGADIFPEHWRSDTLLLDPVPHACPRYTTSESVPGYMCRENSHPGVAETTNACVSDTSVCTRPEHAAGRQRVEYERLQAHVIGFMESVPWLESAIAQSNPSLFKFLAYLRTLDLSAWARPWYTTDWPELLFAQVVSRTRPPPRAALPVPPRRMPVLFVDRGIMPPADDDPFFNNAREVEDGEILDLAAAMESDALARRIVNQIAAVMNEEPWRDGDDAGGPFGFEEF